jgi:NitT/TauT family transport system permease protein
MTAATHATAGDRPGRARRSWPLPVGPALVAPVVVLVAGLALWQGGAFHALFGLKTFTVPYPSAIVAGWDDNSDLITSAIAVTLTAAVLGYALGMALGIALASLLVRYAPTLVDRLLPFLSATNSLPIVALAPLVALFTGPGVILKVIVVAFMTTPIMVVYAVRGLREIDPNALELMDSLEATPGQVYWMVRIRTALPFIFTALKSSIVLALIGTIVAESVRGFEGLGFVIAQSMGSFKAAEAWLALIAIAAIGIGWYAVIEALERVVVPWEAARRRRG